MRPEKKNIIRENPGINEYTVRRSGDRQIKASPMVADAKIKSTVSNKKKVLSSVFIHDRELIS
jgi:hypothetical protein